MLGLFCSVLFTRSLSLIPLLSLSTVSVICPCSI